MEPFQKQQAAPRRFPQEYHATQFNVSNNRKQGIQILKKRIMDSLAVSEVFYYRKIQKLSAFSG
jgi:hypothetical protein